MVSLALLVALQIRLVGAVGYELEFTPTDEASLGARDAGPPVLGPLARAHADEPSAHRRARPPALLRVSGSAGYESQLTPANEASPLNRNNVLELPYATNLADITAFGEVSTESRRLKARLKIRGDASDRQSDEIELGEAFVQFQARDWLDITAGRVIEKWGSGYGWAPTAFVGPAKNPTDPNDRRSTYVGVDMIRADLFIRETSVSLYALEEGAIAARAYRLIGGADLSLYVRRDGDATREGVSVSRVVGDALELHADVAHSEDGLRAVAGGQYTLANDLNVVAEIYHQDDGLSPTEWDAFRALAGDEKAVAAANREYAPLRMGKNYAFLRLARSFIDRKLSAEVITISNLRDRSTVARAALTVTVRPSVSVYVIGTEFFGGKESELAYLQIERVTTMGVRYYF